MVRLCLMASNVYSPGLVFHPEQVKLPPKECPRFLPSSELPYMSIKPGSLDLRHQSKEPWKPVGWQFDKNQFVTIDPSISRPVLIDVQDTRQNPTLFSYGVAKQCTMYDDILKFLVSGSTEIENGDLDLSKLLDLMGRQAVTIDLPPQPFGPYNPCESRLILPSIELDSHKPFLDFMSGLIRRSQVTLHPDGRVSLTGTRTEMNDVLPIVAEFYLSENSTNWRKQPLLVPYFNRRDFKKKAHCSPMGLETGTVAPPTSPEKNKLKQGQKKKSSRKAVEVRDLYKANYLQACENFLSIVTNKNRNGREAISTLKKLDPELTHLLTQFSASIAGTGLAVLFSVVSKVFTSRVPFCSSKLLNTGLGLGLVWLSWAVKRLRDTVISVVKTSRKHGLDEEDVMNNLDRNMREIYFRAAALVAVMVLKLA